MNMPYNLHFAELVYSSVKNFLFLLFMKAKEMLSTVKSAKNQILIQTVFIRYSHWDKEMAICTGN